MNREAMKQQILEALSKKLGDGYHGTLEKVQKTNIDLDGLTILKDGETITLTGFCTFISLPEPIRINLTLHPCMILIMSEAGCLSN